MTSLTFPFDQYWWFYGAFSVFVVLLLVADLSLFHRKAHQVGFREAALWTVVWASLALLFCGGLYAYTAANFGPAVAKQTSLEFLTGYIVEWSLSLDNMFVFVLVFGYFGVANELQHRVLFYGILGALIFRGIFIALGSVLLEYGWMVIVFGAFLGFTGAKMLFADEKPVDLEKSAMLRVIRKFLRVLSGHSGARFFTRVNGKWFATPLLVTLLFIELTDILFAIDSVPAIFAITREPLVVFTSNVFAILGLRSLYFLLAGAVGKFHLLRYGLAIVLMFVGLKMAWLNQAWDGHFPMTISLGVIGGVLAVTIGLSLIFPKKEVQGKLKHAPPG